MRYYLIAGEASGDLHASNLMKELAKLDQEAEFRFLGGDLMQSAGGTLVKHYREMAFMGFIPVLLNARTILRNLKTCREDIRSFQPDIVILIDYPGFNLKMARFVKTELQIPVHYYISPKIWAWKKYRIKDFRRYVDEMYCILPFEKEFYKELNYPVKYVGNPSVDAIADFRINQNTDKQDFIRENDLSGQPVIALLAGSRKQEIKGNLPTMLKVVSEFPQYQAVIAGAPGIDPAFYNQFIHKESVKIIFNNTYSLLQCSQAALVTSGTATLETALFRVPQVVCYYFAAGTITGFIFRRFFHTPYISLVNLIRGKEIVQELFADRFSYKNIFSELKNILTDDIYRNKMLEGYKEVINQLGEPGASARTAKYIYDTLNN